MSTNIGWTNETWNPVTGCSKVSAGCKNCYAEAITERFGTQKFTDVTLHPDRIDRPLHWRKPRLVFVNSMSDLFHKDVPRSFQCRVFQTMKYAPQHTFQILTKRPERMRDDLRAVTRPLPNVWLGVSCEDQATADERIPLLLQTPAAVRFVSCEPLLGSIDLATRIPRHARFLDWVIVGGESGPNRREMDLDHLLSIVDQCKAEGVPCFVKQDSAYKSGQQGRIPDSVWGIKEFPATS